MPRGWLELRGEGPTGDIYPPCHTLGTVVFSNFLPVRWKLMPNDGWYRYVSDGEFKNIDATGEVASRSGTTWYALQRLNRWSDVQRLLALEDPARTDRVGPFYADELPVFDAVPQRTDQPQKLKSATPLSGE